MHKHKNSSQHIFRWKPFQEKNRQMFLNIFLQKIYIKIFSSNWRALQCLVYQLQLEGCSNPLVYKLQPEDTPTPYLLFATRWILQCLVQASIYPSTTLYHPNQLVDHVSQFLDWIHLPLESIEKQTTIQFLSIKSTSSQSAYQTLAVNINYHKQLCLFTNYIANPSCQNNFDSALSAYQTLSDHHFKL